MSTAANQPACCPAAASWGLTVLRLALGVTFVLHGYQKIFVYHPSNVVAGFTAMNIPAPQFTAWFAMLSEFVGGILLILGLLTRLGALTIAATMVGAFVTVHGKNGFFLMGNPPDPQHVGYEFVFILFAAALALVIGGGGALAADRLLFGRRRDERVSLGTARV